MTARIPRFLMVADDKYSSRLIEWAGGGGWSHAANVLADDSIIDARVDTMKFVEPGSGKRYIVPAGVQRRPAHYLDLVPRWVLLEIGGEEHYTDWLNALLSQIGKPYDKDAILDFITGSVSDRNWREQSAWFCDELMVWAWEKAGIAKQQLPDPIFRINPGAAFLYGLGLGARVLASRG